MIFADGLYKPGISPYIYSAGYKCAQYFIVESYNLACDETNDTLKSYYNKFPVVGYSQNIRHKSFR